MAAEITNERELLIEAMRVLNRCSEAMADANKAAGALVQDDRLPDEGGDKNADALFAALRRHCGDASVHRVFIAAHNLGLDLPADLACYDETYTGGDE